MQAFFFVTNIPQAMQDLIENMCILFFLSHDDKYVCMEKFESHVFGLVLHCIGTKVQDYFMG